MGNKPPVQAMTPQQAMMLDAADGKIDGKIGNRKIAVNPYGPRPMPMQYAAPTYMAAPQQYYAPAPMTYSVPQTYSAPVQSYAPQTYSAPVQSYAAPVQSYAAPVSYGASTYGAPAYGAQSSYGNALALDAADGRIDGTFYGAPIVR